MVDEAMLYIADLMYGMDEGTGSAGSKQTIPKWLELGAELIIVDDGSRDDTAQVALSLASRWDKSLQQRRNRVSALEAQNDSTSRRTESKIAPILEMRIVKLEKNRGKGGAVRHVGLELKMSQAPGTLLTRTTQTGCFICSRGTDTLRRC